MKKRRTCRQVIRRILTMGTKDGDIPTTGLTNPTFIAQGVIRLGLCDNPQFGMLFGETSKISRVPSSDTPSTMITSMPSGGRSWPRIDRTQASIW